MLVKEVYIKANFSTNSPYSLTENGEEICAVQVLENVHVLTDDELTKIKIDALNVGVKSERLFNKY